MVSKDTKPRRKLGEKLVDLGLITQDHLNLAIRKQSVTKVLLGKILVDLDFINEDILTEVTSNSSDKWVDVSTIEFNQDALSMIPYDIAKKHVMIPFKIDGNDIHILINDHRNIIAQDAIWATTHKTPILVTSSKQLIQEAIETEYHDYDHLNLIADEMMVMDIDNIDETDESPIIRLVNILIAQAVRYKASDIHIEPEDKIIRIRMRIDGELETMILLPKNIHQYLTSRIKMEAQLDITDNRAPQDGRIAKTVIGKSIEIRVSVLPSTQGEIIVLRLLDKSNLSNDMESLGFSPELKEKMISEVNKPNGVILVSGPTGEGKTTSLYAILLQLNRSKLNIMTVEDPVEYDINGIQQIAVNESSGMSFQSILRSTLRQDPDKIMVGEIRDFPTAEIAMRAGMTGHLVLSSVHTNSAIESVYRLLDIGIDPFIINSTLKGVLGQRLVRKLCSCKKPMEPLACRDTIKSLSLDINTTWKFFVPSGCNLCRHTGYSGRFAIHEYWENKTVYHHLITQKKPASSLLKLSKENGYQTIFDQGISIANKGLTSVSEILLVSQNA